MVQPGRLCTPNHALLLPLFVHTSCADSSFFQLESGVALSSFSAMQIVVLLILLLLRGLTVHTRGAIAVRKRVVLVVVLVDSVLSMLMLVLVCVEGG